jgi:hypothetical protein
LHGLHLPRGPGSLATMKTTRLMTIAAALTTGCAVPAALAATAGAAPTASTPPTITGTAAVGQKLTCNNGTWSAGAGSFTYQWQLADTGSVIGSQPTLTLGSRATGLAVVCVVSATDSTGAIATATSAPAAVIGVAPKLTITKESSSDGGLTLTGKITPAGAARSGLGSLILYRQSASGPQQLTFDEIDTTPATNGTFTLTITGEPTGRHTYILQYVPGAAGYVTQVTITRKFRIHAK